MTSDFEQKLITALKSPSKNIDNATIWNELILLENEYSIADPLPLDYPLFEKIEIR